jgi:hypothetical protein
VSPNNAVPKTEASIKFLIKPVIREKIVPSAIVDEAFTIESSTTLFFLNH